MDHRRLYDNHRQGGRGITGKDRAKSSARTTNQRMKKVAQDVDVAIVEMAARS